MWLGKIAIIMYMFSFGILFFGYYLNQIFQLPALSSNNSMTYSALSSLVGSYTISQEINASLIFGDFIAALTVLFGLLSGNILDTAFHSIPFMDASILLLQTAMFDIASVFLWIYIVSNRSV